MKVKSTEVGAGQYRIYLDGALVYGALEADDKEGYVKCLVDAPGGGAGRVVNVKYGQVEIVTRSQDTRQK